MRNGKLLGGKDHHKMENDLSPTVWRKVTSIALFA